MTETAEGLGVGLCTFQDYHQKAYSKNQPKPITFENISVFGSMHLESYSAKI